MLNSSKNIQTKGFTVVELVVVIVVIGILAAITVVAYRGVQTSARVSSITSDLAGNAKKLDIKKIRNPNRYYPVNSTEMKAVGLEFSEKNYKWVLYCTDGESYKIAARMIDTDRWWVSGSEVTAAESTAPGLSGSSSTTCTNIGYGSGTRIYGDWLLSNSGWSI